MFDLITIEDEVCISADQLGNFPVAVRAALLRKYVHRVLDGHGLCVGVREILEWQLPKVPANIGSVYSTVKFNIVVFCPRPGEVFLTSVVASSKDGIQLSTGFSEAIFIPASELPQPSFLFAPQSGHCLVAS